MSLISKVLNVGETMFSQKGWQVLQRTPEDNKAVQQIQAAHCPDANIVVNEKAILIISQQILNRASPSSLLDLKSKVGVVDDKASQHAISDALAFTIHKIGCELSCNCSGEGDLKAVTLSVFNTLAKYSWDAKVTLAVAAFAASYGELCLLSQQHATNTLAKYVYLLKPLPDVSERETLIMEVLKAVIDVAYSIIELIDLPTQFISPDRSPYSDALTQIPTAAYFAINAIVACSRQSIGLVNVGHQYAVSITESRKKLTELIQILKSYHTTLETHLDHCRNHIFDQEKNQMYYVILNIFSSKTPVTDGMEVFTAFFQFRTKEDLPFFNGVNKKKVGIEVLRGKTVIFIISRFDISDEEIQEIVQQAWKPDRKYEIVWIPIVEVSVTEEIKREIQRKANLMPWYSLHYSTSYLHDGVIKYIKEKWHFEKKPLFPVIDAKGKLVRENAYHMLMIWGSQGFPFDIQREQTLWKGAKWSLQWLVDESDKPQLVKEGKVVYFYGGEDIEWIRKFVSEIKEVKGEGLIIELIYVGKKQSIIETINKEKLSKCWDLAKIKRFRAHLEWIMCSKMQLGFTVKDDSVLSDVTLMIAALDNGREWTVISHGTEGVITMNGQTAMNWVVEINKSKPNLTIKNFFTAAFQVFQQVVRPVPAPAPAPAPGQPTVDGGVIVTPKPPLVEDIPKHCNHIEVPTTNGISQESMFCVDCHRPMEKVVVFKCCIE